MIRQTEFMKAPVIHITTIIFYEFEGWLFEYDRNKPFGPWPCNKDFQPKKRAGDKFYEMFNKFIKLSIEKQDDFEIERIS